jgi:60 kDa SS-A/Ro ribonucleoprotein
MAKFSGRTPSQATGSVMVNNFTTREDYTTNYEGAGAFEINDVAQRLYTEIATSMVGEDKFYISGKDQDAKILHDINAIATEDPIFCLQLAAYARNKLKLRSAPIVLLAETAAAQEPGAELTGLRDYVPKILRRADEPAELIGYWITRFGPVGDAAPGRAIPNALKKGIADSLESWDEYQLEKYNRNGNVTLRDVLRIVHPKPTNATRSLLYRHLVYGDTSWQDVGEIVLPIIAAKRKFTQLTKFDAEAKRLMKDGHLTWEVAISQFGNKPEIWNELDLPIFATVRNLRNILESRATTAVNNAVKKLSDPNIIKNSRMLPFRFYQAAKELYNCNGDPFDTKQVINALNKALELAVANVPDIGGRTAIMIDCSNSMNQLLTSKSSITYKEIAALFGAIATTAYPSSILIPFARYSKLYNTPTTIVQTTSDILNLDLAYATLINEAFKVLGDTFVDRIILFSDMQCYNQCDSYWGQDVPTALPLAEYRRSTNPACKHYSVDLAGYGTAQVPTDDPQTALIAGWSERVLDFIRAFEVEGKSAVEMIRESV